MDRTERKDCQAAQLRFPPAGKAASCRLLAVLGPHQRAPQAEAGAGSLGLRASQPRGSLEDAFPPPSSGPATLPVSASALLEVIRHFGEASP